MNSDFANVRCIAVISDTHGYLSPDLMTAIKNVDLIIHAGDMDRPDNLAMLETIAPVLAVCGNMDRGDWTDRILSSELLSIEGIYFYILHDLFKLDIDPESIGVKVVISGHTHRPLIEQKKDVVYINPGSASQPRGGYKPSFALITLNNHHLEFQIKDI